MTTPEEQKDLDQMQVDLNKIARGAMDALRDLARADSTELKHSGYKTNEQAVLSTFQYYQKQMDARIKAHIKKWPDK